MPKPPQRQFTCFYRPPFDHGFMADVRRGDPDAQFALGRVYFEGRADASSSTVTRDGRHEVASFTRGVPQDFAEAMALLQKAADQGHTEARQLLEVVRLHTPKGVH